MSRRHAYHACHERSVVEWSVVERSEHGESKLLASKGDCFAAYSGSQ